MVQENVLKADVARICETPTRDGGNHHKISQACKKQEMIKCGTFATNEL